MSVNVNTLGLWYFNQTLYDVVSNNNFVLNNEDPYTAGPAVTGTYETFSRFSLFENKYKSIYGLSLSNGVSYESDVISYVGGEFTIGFWMKTTSALGFVRHYVTKVKTPKTAPIIAKGDKATLSVEEEFESTSFVVVEEAYNEITNRLSLMLSANGATVASTIHSEEYSPGLHHYLLTYDPDNLRARIDVDGVFGSWQAAPADIYSSSRTIKINSLNPNYLTHQYGVRGAVLRDLYIKNSVADDENEAIRNYTYGVDYVTDATLSNTDFGKLAISYTQPNTIATNSIVVNGDSIYLGMSNGDILKGVQPIWDNEFTFDTTTKNKKVNAVGTITYSADGMVLQGSFVKE